jgi:Family of unknown function (DUF6982)/PilZ domain
VRHRANLSLVSSTPAARLANLAPSDRRAHERHTVSALEWLNEARLKYGPGVSLIDLSVGGAQIETQGHRLHPGSTLVIELAGRQGEFAIPARVIRCCVSQIVPHPTFRGALEFKRPFSFPETRPTASPSVCDANPVHEHARLTTTLRRLAARESSGSPSGMTAVCETSLAAALAILESPAGRRAGSQFANELGRLFKAITRALEGDGRTDLVGDLAERLRRIVPARSIRLLHGASMSTPVATDAVRFEVPSPNGAPRALVVELPRGSRLEDWHLQFLKAASHLVTFATDLSEARQAAPEPPAPPADSDNEAGWHRLVVRYNDGRMLKGFGRDFFPAKGQVHVWPRPDAPPQSRISVQLTHLKAVFFVHDFAGATGIEMPPTSANSGRIIDVTFVDGEVLSGRTLAYSADGAGFFMTPTDGTSNNHRIFVVNNAVRTVQFP